MTKGLSERLRAFIADCRSDNNAPMDDYHGRLDDDIETILDRLTVDGLAGVVGKAITDWTLGVDAPEDDLRTTIAVALLDYITAPSGEFSGFIPGPSSTAASSSAMASDSGQVKS